MTVKRLHDVKRIGYILTLVSFAIVTFVLLFITVYFHKPALTYESEIFGMFFIGLSLGPALFPEAFTKMTAASMERRGYHYSDRDTKACYWIYRILSPAFIAFGLLLLFGVIAV
jgi:uncharacterized membrane protein YhaH (DUF805 family)